MLTRPAGCSETRHGRGLGHTYRKAAPLTHPHSLIFASYPQVTELNIYTDFLRIVLEIVNAILTYALPRNPEVVYALMHRQELFAPFKDHPRFVELLENIQV